MVEYKKNHSHTGDSIALKKIYFYWKYTGCLIIRSSYVEGYSIKK